MSPQQQVGDNGGQRVVEVYEARIGREAGRMMRVATVAVSLLAASRLTCCTGVRTSPSGAQVVSRPLPVFAWPVFGCGPRCCRIRRQRPAQYQPRAIVGFASGAPEANCVWPSRPRDAQAGPPSSVMRGQTDIDRFTH